MEFLGVIHKCNWDLSVFFVHTAWVLGEQLTSEPIATLDKFQSSSKAKYTDYVLSSSAIPELHDMVQLSRPFMPQFPL